MNKKQKLTLIRLLLDKSRKVKQSTLWNSRIGILCNLFRSNNKVSKACKLSKAFSLILHILLSESFNIWSVFNEKVPFSMRCILFLDKSNICRDSRPTKLSEGMYITWLFEISMVSRNELLANSFSGREYKKLFDKSTWNSFFVDLNAWLSISSR